MSRKKIAAAALMLVALGLGLAGYIQATRASGKGLRTAQTGYPAGAGSRGYRMNHQIGNDEAFFMWSGVAHDSADGGAHEGAQHTADNTNSSGGSGHDDEIGPSRGDEHEAGGAVAQSGAHSPPGAGGSADSYASSAPDYLRLARGYGGGGAGGGGGGARLRSSVDTGTGDSTSNTGEEHKPSNEPGNPRPTDPPVPPPYVAPGNPHPTDPPVHPLYVVPGKPQPTDPPVDPPYVEPGKPRPTDPRVDPPHVASGDPNETPPHSVPEPASLALMGIGLAALGLSRRRRRR